MENASHSIARIVLVCDFINGKIYACEATKTTNDCISSNTISETSRLVERICGCAGGPLECTFNAPHTDLTTTILLRLHNCSDRHSEFRNGLHTRRKKHFFIANVLLRSQSSRTPTNNKNKTIKNGVCFVRFFVEISIALFCMRSTRRTLLLPAALV